MQLNVYDSSKWDDGREIFMQAEKAGGRGVGGWLEQNGAEKAAFWWHEMIVDDAAGMVWWPKCILKFFFFFPFCIDSTNRCA